MKIVWIIVLDNRRTPVTMQSCQHFKVCKQIHLNVITLCFLTDFNNTNIFFSKFSYPLGTTSNNLWQIAVTIFGQMEKYLYRIGKNHHEKANPKSKNPKQFQQINCHYFRATAKHYFLQKFSLWNQTTLITLCVSNAHS